LAEFAASYTGVDRDGRAIAEAQKNFAGDKRSFIEDDFLRKRYGTFDTVVSLDVIEHIRPEVEAQFFATVRSNLGEDGVCVIGTPNTISDKHRSPANPQNADRLAESMRKLFHNVFIFGMNDEVIHTGFVSTSHYLIALGCYLKTERGGNG
jgi:cyclopropane fatty-acyl-phospholipid synthase-like methyltransferase